MCTLYCYVNCKKELQARVKYDVLSLYSKYRPFYFTFLCRNDLLLTLSSTTPNSVSFELKLLEKAPSVDSGVEIHIWTCRYNIDCFCKVSSLTKLSDYGMHVISACNWNWKKWNDTKSPCISFWYWVRSLTMDRNERYC